MTFHYLLMAVHAVYNRRLMSLLADTGLTPGQPKVLDYLGESDGASQKEIAASCFIEPATLTSVLNGMEARGLIERRRMNGNRRSYYIYLTEKGREQQQQVAKAFARLEEETFAGMPPEQMREMERLFRNIYANFTKE